MALLRLVGSEDGISMPKAAKRLGLRHSQLMRLLTLAGGAETVSGLNWIAIDEGEPVRLTLTPLGRAQLDRQLP